MSSLIYFLITLEFSGWVVFGLLFPFLVVLVATSSYWLILFMGLRPFKTISRETKIISKLSNRFGIRTTRAFLSPLYPSSIFLIQSAWGRPKLIIGTLVANELSTHELEKLFENLILELKSNRSYVRTNLTTFVFLFTFPLMIIDTVFGPLIRNRTLRHNLLKILGYPPIYLAQSLSRELNIGQELSIILPKLKRLREQSLHSNYSYMEEVFSFCRIEKVAGLSH
ncbi:MAG: hypothetical protein A2X86_04740 [Bdellovibrionales bacterium GWA2_49_15]|nr:MAG: hypothetical protein A2X86_04740 [Bdellovibrionales bacterium GWA2_49_15]